MLRSNLKSVLETQFNQYLTVDNKKPESTLDYIGGFFSTSGAAGRQRANDYLNSVINNPDYDEDQLLKQVLKDLNDEDKLGSGLKLRNRIYKGLCDHFGIKDTQLENTRQNIHTERMKNVVAASNGMISVPYITDAEVYRKALLSHPAVVQSMNKQHGNITFSYTGDESL